ncbi:MAG TPA: transcription elongation factor GreA [Actinomycetota bacterium]|nr:transcription elongation factor GreA [Actinomycetota bacterium]
MEGTRFRRNPGDEPSAVLTRDAYDRLRAELERLKGEGREHIAERLLHARELGDIRENAEFDAAKNEQGLMEARIRELERMLKDPDIVEHASAAEIVESGTLVTVRAVEDETDEDTYLVAASKEERAPGVRTVSVESPLGRALLGRRVGERVTYDAPGGRFEYEIVGLDSR